MGKLVASRCECIRHKVPPNSWFSMYLFLHDLEHKWRDHSTFQVGESSALIKANADAIHPPISTVKFPLITAATHCCPAHRAHDRSCAPAVGNPVLPEKCSVMSKIIQSYNDSRHTRNSKTGWHVQCTDIYVCVYV